MLEEVAQRTAHSFRRGEGKHLFGGDVARITEGGAHPR